MDDVSERLKREALGAEFSSQYADLCMDAHNEIERLRSVVAQQCHAIAPFAYALKFARKRLGKHPDINDTTALASRWITYESLKDALSVYNQHKAGE